jgi:hypothetical protein
MSEAPLFILDPPDGAPTDFDFLIGDWQISNRRLKARWTRRPEWERFESRSRCEPRLGGVSNVKEIVFDNEPGGQAGMTLRLFDPAMARWSIYWISSRDGRLQPPVHGGFEGDEGEFRGEDIDDGRFILVRYRWSKIGPAGGPRWQQAFSQDGHAWETNWVMDFRRA